MEILQLVRVRQRRWRVTDIHVHDNCTLIDVDCADASATRVSRGFLTPFDDVEPVRLRNRPRTVGPRAWQYACRALLAADAPPGSLHSLTAANIELYPHQLEPALALFSGSGSRVLLADEVGLGKTIQAGLIAAELVTRRCAERVLILAPAALVSQWCRELGERFSLAVTMADAATLRLITASLPVGVNPWSTISIAVSSIDYVKRSEVLPALLACRWDVVIVDEAHTASVDSERHAAVHSLASRAAYVVLLTATPHNGDERAFVSLCGVGALDDRLIVFRRTRRDIRRDAIRRMHMLNVRPTTAELRMFAALGHYSRAVTAEHGNRALALSVLEKRAFSSAWSLARSVERRLQLLAASPFDSQLSLPFDDPDGEQSSDDAPPAWPADLFLANPDRERTLLAEVLASANAAVETGESKLRALRRLLRRAAESALVFTEYRDTASHVRDTIAAATMLHGGLNREQRSDVLDDFVRRPNAVLIATDAAGQGLNLHKRCRVVVNLELPWNPLRLEQRIGRVDRIGQSRRVHAFIFVGSEGGEGRILERLDRRVAIAGEQIDALGSEPSLASEAASEVSRVSRARSLIRKRDEVALADLESSRPWKIRARSRLRVTLAGRSLFIYRFAARDENGRLLQSRLVGITTPSGSTAEVDEAVARLLDDCRSTFLPASRAFWAARIARERAIVRTTSPRAPDLFQPALFHRRIEQEHVERRGAAVAIVEQHTAKLAEAERQSRPPVVGAELLLIAIG